MIKIKNQELIDFPVERIKIKNPKQKDTGWDILYNPENGDNLGIVSREYQVVKHQDALASIIEGFSSAKIPIESVKTEVQNNGSKMFSSFKFKDEINLGFKTNKNKVGDIVSMGFVVVNSYDRSLKFALKAEIHRLVCENGLIIPESDFKQSKRHLSYLNVETMVNEFVENSEESMKEVIPKIKELNSKETSFDFLTETLCEIPGWIQKETLNYLQERDFVDFQENGDSFEVEIINKFSYWEFLNSLTFSLTHSENSAPQSRMKLSEKVYERFLLS